jgi:hypothetical protein
MLQQRHQHCEHKSSSRAALSMGVALGNLEAREREHVNNYPIRGNVGLNWFLFFFYSRACQKLLLLKFGYINGLLHSLPPSPVSNMMENS